MTDRLYRIVAPHFVAGVIVSHTGTIIEAAPILSYARRRPIEWLAAYVAKRGWHMREVLERKEEAA